MEISARNPAEHLFCKPKSRSEKRNRVRNIFHTEKKNRKYAIYGKYFWEFRAFGYYDLDNEFHFRIG